MKVIGIFIILVLTLGASNYLNSQSSLDIYLYSIAYKGLNNQTELDSVNKPFSNKKLSVAEQKLNKIAFANAIDQLGNHDKALELMKSIGVNSENELQMPMTGRP